MLNKIYAIKQRMTQEFLEGKRTPITSLVVPQHQVLTEKTIDKDGYRSAVIGLGQDKKMTTKKSLLGFLKSKALDFTPKKIKEIRLADSDSVSGQLDIDSLITTGSLVTVGATSKGKGFAGVMKRWNFRGGPRTHGQSDRKRAPGSIGRGTTPGRIVKGKKMPGRMGGVNVSVKNLKVISFDPSSRILKIKGAVPGNTNTLVTITITKLATKA